MNSFALIVPAMVGLLILTAIFRVSALAYEVILSLRAETHLPRLSRAAGWVFAAFLLGLDILLVVGLYKAVEAVLTW